MDETNVLIRNKTRLVTQGYSQEKDIDYDKTYAPITRVEVITILLCLCMPSKFKKISSRCQKSYFKWFYSIKGIY